MNLLNKNVRISEKETPLLSVHLGTIYLVICQFFFVESVIKIYLYVEIFFKEKGKVRLLKAVYKI